MLNIPEYKSLIKSVLPEFAKKLIRVNKHLNKSERRIYWQLKRDAMLRKRINSPVYHVHRPIENVLFVCLGNIIRSPMAQVLLEQSLHRLGIHNVNVYSVGVKACLGRRADERARLVAAEFGVSLEKHRTQPPNQEMVDHMDAIFVLDMLVEAEFLHRFPQARDKISLLGRENKHLNHEKNAYQLVEFADPFDGSTADIKQCYESIKNAIDDLAKHIVACNGHQQHALSLVAGI